MSMSIAFFGDVNGSLKLRTSGRMPPAAILRFHPEVQAQLDDVEKQGWKYLYIETVGTAEADFPVQKSTYRIVTSPRLESDVEGPPRRVIDLDMGTALPEVTSVPEVIEFRVNVCSKSFPRAATVDLARGIVTYLHDPYWRWEKSWEGDAQKLSDAKEISEIATWLLEVKKFKLQEAFKLERYKELSKIFKAMQA